jgi:hypothetical protein
MTGGSISHQRFCSALCGEFADANGLVFLIKQDRLWKAKRRKRTLTSFT